MKLIIDAQDSKPGAATNIEIDLTGDIQVEAQAEAVVLAG